MNLPLQVDLFKESDMERILPMVVKLIEEADPIKASIGVPFYWVAHCGRPFTFHSSFIDGISSDWPIGARVVDHFACVGFILVWDHPSLAACV